jgi:hypothetical protein
MGPPLCDFCQVRQAVVTVTVNALPSGTCIDQFNKCEHCSLQIVETSVKFVERGTG